jgi:hypothetical protein
MSIWNDFALGVAGLRDGIENEVKQEAGFAPDSHHAADTYAEQTAEDALDKGATASEAEAIQAQAQETATDAEARQKVLERAAKHTADDVASKVKAGAEGAASGGLSVLWALVKPLSLVLIPAAVLAAVYLAVTSGAVKAAKRVLK